MRKRRLNAILSIIREQEIENQECLLSELKKLGFEATQATISRDIRHLRLSKIAEDGVSRYVREESLSAKNPMSADIFKQAVISADYALNTVVLKCHAGWAGGACSAFDRMNFPHIVGTIAGDDTVFILARSENEAKALYEKLSEML
jgi:transcriptional regulator of arginine metabolism